MSAPSKEADAARARRLSTGDYVVLTAVFHREGRNWLGEVVELGTAASGRSLPLARERLGEFLALHLNALEQVGECERVLQERHIKIHRGKAPRAATKVTLNVDMAAESFASPLVYRLPCSLPEERLVAVG